VWQTLQVFKNKRFPLLNCSGVKVTVFVAFKGIVRTASSNSTAQEKELKLEKTKQDKMKRERILIEFFIFSK
jgi:peroxiredoxin family protein